MRKRPSKEYRAAYQKYDRARQRSALYRARAAAGLEITTGFYPHELVRLAELSEQGRLAEFAAVNPSLEQGEVADEFGIFFSEINVTLDDQSLTNEFRSALLTLHSEVSDAKNRWLKTLTPSPSANDRQHGSLQARFSP